MNETTEEMVKKLGEKGKWVGNRIATLMLYVCFYLHITKTNYHFYV